MIKFSKICLNNGLRVLAHEDRSTPLVAMNILYGVGSRDEDPDRTGLAHLFEHLMFGGTESIPEFDRHLQIAGGENNAFTNPDITDYYITLPANNIETGFWLESDRMNSLDFSQKNLDTQKNVVIEEFNQRYLNQPYGDAMLMLRPLAYKVHPYRWPTIGMDADHVRNTGLHEIKEFFFSHYAPDNAILTLTGNITPDNAFRLSEKWFGTIEKRNVNQKSLPAEPPQTEERILTVERNVPASALYKAWHMGPRLSSDFYTLDLITDLLAGGESGRLFTKLVREKKLFSEINTYITSDIDPGLVILHGKIMQGIDIYKANYEVNNIILTLIEKKASSPEMEKVKNKYESANIYSNTNILNKAMNLAYYELLGNPEMINTEVDLYRKTDRAMVLEAAGKYLTDSNCSTLYYKSKRDSI
ncbi:MAG: zinc protease [Bacteroidota bacterium]|nr:zinc protease [Bacteroidota bacterium]MDQ1332091.1 zinc protease [Bacteroidota bacterium]